MAKNNPPQPRGRRDLSSADEVRTRLFGNIYRRCGNNCFILNLYNKCSMFEEIFQKFHVYFTIHLGRVWAYASVSCASLRLAPPLG